MRLNALFRLAFATAPHPQVLSLAARINSPDHYAKGTQSGIPKSEDFGIALPPPVSQLVSGSISLRSQRFFSIFPHGTCSLSVAYEYLALEDGSPRFSRGSTYRVILGNSTGKCFEVLHTGLSPSWAGRSRPFCYLKTRFLSAGISRFQHAEPHDTPVTTPRSLT